MHLPFFKKEQPKLSLGSPRGARLRPPTIRPQKPKASWGRKERFLVGWLLLGTVLIGIGSWLSTRPEVNLPTFPKEGISLPSETIVIEGERQKVTPLPTHGEKAKVIKVIDGDTVVVEGGQTVRYIGVDSPERGKCFFEEAKAANERLVLSKKVEFEKDISETDRYKRLLRYIWVIGDVRVMVNEQLVRDGYATVSTYPPDVAYQDRFLAAQKEARDAGRGLWAKDGQACESLP